jgi:hypothetical protein
VFSGFDFRAKMEFSPVPLPTDKILRPRRWSEDSSPAIESGQFGFFSKFIVFFPVDPHLEIDQTTKFCAGYCHTGAWCVSNG